MGKRGSGDHVQQLQALQKSLKEKMQAQADATAAAAAPAEPAEECMPPPAKTAKKEKKEKKGKRESPAESSTPTSSEPESSVKASPASGSTSLKRLRHVSDEVETRPKAKAKAASKPAAKASTKKQLTPPDFEVTWENHHLVMKHFGINEEEATASLLAVIGPDERYKKFWGKFDTKTAENHGVEGSLEHEEKMDAEEDEDAGEEFLGGGPGPQKIDPDGPGDGDDDDVETSSSTTSHGRGPPPPPAASAEPVASAQQVMDDIETQPLETPEPVIVPVASKPDAAEEAKLELAKKVKSAPTPAKALEKQVLGYENCLQIHLETSSKSNITFCKCRVRNDISEVLFFYLLTFHTKSMCVGTQNRLIARASCLTSDLPAACCALSQECIILCKNIPKTKIKQT